VSATTGTSVTAGSLWVNTLTIKRSNINLNAIEKINIIINKYIFLFIQKCLYLVFSSNKFESERGADR
jgi:hypothetical protein